MPPVLMLPQLRERERERVKPNKKRSGINQPYSCCKTALSDNSALKRKGNKGNSRSDHLWWRLAMGICVVVVGVV
jgi:hypothetical protein